MGAQPFREDTETARNPCERMRYERATLQKGSAVRVWESVYL